MKQTRFFITNFIKSFSFFTKKFYNFQHISNNS